MAKSNRQTKILLDKNDQNPQKCDYETKKLWEKILFRHRHYLSAHRAGLIWVVVWDG